MKRPPSIRVKTEEMDHQKEDRKLDLLDIGLNLSFKSANNLDPPREIILKNYSLAPDMIGGWKPKKAERRIIKNPFPLNYQDDFNKILLEGLSKSKDKSSQKLVYLGPRKTCSYSIHEGMPYKNPYDNSNAMNKQFGIKKNRQKWSESGCFLAFDSDFEGGNLDCAVQINQKQFDLFMRVDTNTRGHTNWYFFEIKNQNFIGKVKLNLCNFRREISLYQQGLKPFISSEKQGGEWNQGGEKVTYHKYKPKHPFFNEVPDQPKKRWALSFEYDFKHTNDSVKFAYSAPYLYSTLLTFLDTLKNIERLPPLKSLSGLDIPLLKITDQDQDQSFKKVALISARVHPGQSNSSFVMQGFLKCICGDNVLALGLRKKYMLYVVPMLNPDGVIAGNYRTSMFGKDLNRTYDKNRKYAFPETYYLLEQAQKLKNMYKEKFSIYIDLHGHSSKKNVFMYGPDFSLQKTNYQLCRQLPKTMSLLTNYFRYYSCSFRISEAKAATSRAVFLRSLNIPFSYTMETSNGIFLDKNSNDKVLVGIGKWRQIGTILCHALQQLQLQKPKKLQRMLTEIIPKKPSLTQTKDNEDICQVNSSNSDCDAQEEDLPEEVLIELENMLREGKCKQFVRKIQSVQSTKVEQSTNNNHSPASKIIKQPCLNREKKAQSEKNCVLPSILKSRQQRQFFDTLQKKPHKMSPQKLFKKDQYIPTQLSTFVEREIRPLIFVQEMDDEDDHKKLRRSLDNRITRRQKMLKSMISRLKTIK